MGERNLNPFPGEREVEGVVEEFMVEAFNVLSGVAFFAVLTVPNSWRVHASIYGAEVYRYMRDDRMTVIDGVSYHCLTSPEGAAFDLKLVVKPAGETRPPKTWVKCWRDGKVEAFYWLRKTGLLRKREKPCLTILMNCPESERTLLIEVSGPLLPKYLDTLYESLRLSRCR